MLKKNGVAVALLAVLLLVMSGCAGKRHGLPVTGMGPVTLTSGADVVSQELPGAEMARAIQLVKEVNEFSKRELQFNRTVNFQKYSNDNTVYFCVRLVPKSKLTYDYQQKEVKSTVYKTIQEALQEAEENKETHDAYVYQLDAVAGGYPLTNAFVEIDKPRQVFLVLHEDWHDNSDFSLSLEEATGNVIGYVGAIEFFKKYAKNKELARQAEINLQWARIKARLAVKYYQKLEKLYAQKGTDESAREYARGEIFKAAKKECAEIEKKTGLGFSNLEFNNATLSTWMTYDRYMDVAYRVYLGTGKNLKKTAAIFRSIRPLSDKSTLRLWLLGKQTVRQYEEEVVQYLEQFADPPSNK
jgi:hypothetical protein